MRHNASHQAAFVVAIALSASVVHAQNVEPLINGLGNRDMFRLSWADEFNGSTLDNTKWRHEFTGKRWDAQLVPEAVTLAGGNMTVRTWSEPYLSGVRHYTGAVSTRDKFQQAYGYWEARIDFSHSPGMWGGFWVHSWKMTGNLPPELLNRPDIIGAEIDIMEYRTVDQWGTDISMGGNQAVHWNGYAPNQRSLGNMDWSHDIGNGYHTFGLLWARDRYEFYVDGQKSWTVTEPNAISSIEQSIILSSEVMGGNWAGNAPAGGYGTYAGTNTWMKIDYVRVFTFNQDDLAAILPEPATLSALLASSALLARRRRR